MSVGLKWEKTEWFEECLPSLLSGKVRNTVLGPD